MEGTWSLEYWLFEYKLSSIDKIFTRQNKNSRCTLETLKMVHVILSYYCFVS